MEFIDKIQKKILSSRKRDFDVVMELPSGISKRFVVTGVLEGKFKELQDEFGITFTYEKIVYES